MHVRADVGGLEMPRSLALEYGKANSSIHVTIENSINDLSLVVVVMIM
jgi:hypothetical protein